MIATGVDLVEEILELKRERNAVILAHNYQVKEIQELADFVGDSLGLGYKARETDADVIAFCGVHFMAETAKIVNPTKTVVLPDLDAGCSLWESCPPDKLAAYLQEHADKNYYVIAYINCSAGVKALSDVHLHERQRDEDRRGRAEGPEHSLRAGPKSRLVGDGADRAARWNCGRAIVTSTSSSRGNAIERIQAEYPDAPVVAHPECTFAVRLLADEVCSTEKMISLLPRASGARAFIIVTESGMLHRLRREMPDKIFIPGPTDHCACADCRYMKMNTLEKLHDCLLNLEPRDRHPGADPRARRAADPANAGVEQVASRATARERDSAGSAISIDSHERCADECGRVSPLAHRTLSRRPAHAGGWVFPKQSRRSGDGGDGLPEEPHGGSGAAGL